MASTTIITKQETLYGAYAPEFGVSAWGSCRDEALNNLESEIRQRDGKATSADAARPVPDLTDFRHGLY